MGRVRFRCCVPQCRTICLDDKKPDERFFLCPNPNRVSSTFLRRQAELRLDAWRKVVSEKLTVSSRICGKHFVSGQPAPLACASDIDWVPMLLLPNKSINAVPDITSKAASISDQVPSAGGYKTEHRDDHYESANDRNYNAFPLFSGETISGSYFPDDMNDRHTAAEDVGDCTPGIDMASSEQTVPGKRILKPIKTKLHLKKADVRQCRLCMRILPQADTFDTMTPGSNLRQKILDAVEVEIWPSDEVTSVCTNCIMMVDIIIDFQLACRNADMLHRTKQPMMLHSGSWMSDESKSCLASCHRLIQRNHVKMEELVRYACAKNGEAERLIEGKDTVLEASRDPVMNFEPNEEEVEIKTEEVSDSELSNQRGTDQDAQVKKAQTMVSTKTPRYDKTFMCDQCGKTMQPGYREQHLNMHKGIKPYKCPVESCSQRCASELLMNIHIKNIHRKQKKRYECKICNKTIKGRVSFKHHLQTHQMNNALKVPCDVCGKTFYKHYIRDHKFIHTGETPYKCEFCDRRFAARSNLTIHRRKQHSDQLQNQG